MQVLSKLRARLRDRRERRLTAAAIIVLDARMRRDIGLHERALPDDLVLRGATGLLPR